MNIEAANAILDEMEGVSGDMYDGSLAMHEDNFHDYARRIRDALEEDVTAPLNMAECRSALEAIAEETRSGSISAHPIARLIERTCEKALEKPPRNCDRFADFNEAIRTFAKERPNDEKKWDMERYARFAMWLFALTEKGEADESK